MFEETIKFILGGSLSARDDEVNRQNRLALRYLANGGIPVSIANILAQSVIDEAPVSKSLWMLGYFVLLAFVERLVLPQRSSRATLLVYLFEAPVMLLAILLGTVWDPGHQATTFLLFAVVLPVFVLDMPIRVMGVTIGWAALFSLLCIVTKDPSLARIDLTHVAEFMLMSIVVSFVVLRLRNELIVSLERTRYHLEHDTLTGSRNRRSLESNVSRYLGHQLFVVATDINHLVLHGDFYGHEFVDELMTALAKSLTEVYGEKDTYRYESDMFLSIVRDGSEHDVQERIERLRELMATLHSSIAHVNVTCSCGYASGMPQIVEDLHGMIQLAVINEHMAKGKGEGQTIGCPFDAETLRAGIVESSMTLHAHSYEINQLTGLPSMTYFIARGTELLLNVADLDRHPVVGYLNIERFHTVNDELGYVKGDELIKYAADQLREALPQRHLTYITGSQFGILCYLDEIDEAMRQVNERLEMWEPGRPVRALAGFVEYHKGDELISLMDNARHAYARIEQDQTYRVYDASLDEEYRLRQHIIATFTRALDEGWPKVYYQPIVRASDGKVCALEALSRWDDPEYGMLPPSRFVGVLEDEGLISELSLYVVRQILKDFKRLDALGLELVPVSVNLSRTDFFSLDLVRNITTLMDEAGYPYDLLHIEVTESLFTDNQELLSRELDRFHNLGFSVWMDDFGSEYSTLNLLQELNFDVIKLDMRFMRDFTPNSRNAIIVSDIIAMCKHLGMVTLVEGVETKEHSESLKLIGTDLMQGYHFSRPQPLDVLLERWQYMV